MQSHKIGLPTAYRADQSHLLETRGHNREAVILYTNVWLRNSWLESHFKVSSIQQPYAVQITLKACVA